jgi:hypothetical protein
LWKIPLSDGWFSDIIFWDIGPVFLVCASDDVLMGFLKMLVEMALEG